MAVMSGTLRGKTMKKLAMNAITLGAMAFAFLGLAGIANAAPLSLSAPGPGQIVAASVLSDTPTAPIHCGARTGGLRLGYLCN
jgi:hypothetical protein